MARVGYFLKSISYLCYSNILLVGLISGLLKLAIHIFCLHICLW